MTEGAPGLSEMPMVGFGTMEFVDGSATPEAVGEALRAALAAGYRHIDSAELYATHPHVRAAISASGVPRRDLWITSKIKGLPTGDLDKVRARTVAIIDGLGAGGYLDLLLVHWPGPEDLDLDDPSSVEARCGMEAFTANIKGAWDNMRALQREGLVRRIGVSNFYPSHLAALKAACPEALPFANQIFLDAVHHEAEFVSAMQQDGIRPIAYRPVALLAMYAMAADMGDGTHAQLQERATAAGAASIQQFVLAALLARGIHVIPKSKQPARIQENLAAAALARGLGDAALQGLAENAETLDAMGMTDELALAFRQVGA